MGPKQINAPISTIADLGVEKFDLGAPLDVKLRSLGSANEQIE